MNCESEGDFWIGNEYLTKLTNSENKMSARIDIYDWPKNACDPEKFGYYEIFSVTSETDGYRLKVGEYLEQNDIIGIGDTFDGYVYSGYRKRFEQKMSRNRQNMLEAEIAKKKIVFQILKKKLG